MKKQMQRHMIFQSLAANRYWFTIITTAGNLNSTENCSCSKLE